MFEECDDRPPPPEVRPLLDIPRPIAGEDPNELLRHRYLCRRGGLLLVGPTGIGKSSFLMQAAITWALGKTFFGIDPARPLKSLLIQAENDDGDLAEMRDGVMAFLDLTPEEREHVRERVYVATEQVRTGYSFFTDVCRPLLTEARPDLLMIDPALSYLGGETSSQKDVGAFLRNGLNPLLTEFDCAVVVAHHTNKPIAGTEKPNWSAGDFAYLGSGSAEWANWARAVLAIRAVGSHSVFELHAGKRGTRLRWQSPEGRTYSRFIAHAREPGMIAWREADPAEIEALDGRKGGRKGGRPRSSSAADLFRTLPPEGLRTKDWLPVAKEEEGISESSFHRFRRELEAAGKILKSASGLWQPILEKP